MCLERVTQNKFKKHMTEFHAASCPEDMLTEMCREAAEGPNFDQIIEEEAERQNILRRKRKESGGLRGMFRRKGEQITGPEQMTGPGNTLNLMCVLCRGDWTGTSREEMRKHLEKAHKVVFNIKELTGLSESRPEDLDPADEADEESQGEEEGILTETSETLDTSVDTTSGR